MKLENIKEVREEKNVSLRALAEKAEISYSYICLLENGKKDNPSFRVIEKIAIALGVPISTFL